MRRCLVDLVVALVGAVALVYVLNPGFGVGELLLDNLPGVGNLDEAAATGVLLACLGYFGIDARRWIDALRALGGRPPLRLPARRTNEPEKGAGEEPPERG